MIKVDRSYPAPQSLAKRIRYDEDDVVDQLVSDFHNKCYICGIQPIQDPEIEHLLPHENGKYPDRKFDWDNLFWSCRHCNNVKNQRKYDKNVLDCCQVDPEKVIDFIFKDGNVYAQAKNKDDKVAVNTAQLVTDVFNKTNTGMRIYKTQTRRNALYKEMNVLFDNLENYRKNQENVAVKRKLKALLNRSSQFAEYKRNYIRTYYQSDTVLSTYIE